MLCTCGNDADFCDCREPVDGGKHEPHGLPVQCVRCYCELPDMLGAPSAEAQTGAKV